MSFVKNSTQYCPCPIPFPHGCFSWLKMPLMKKELNESCSQIELDEIYWKGQLFKHDERKCCKSISLELYVITYIIFVNDHWHSYVDDEALIPFTSRHQLCKELSVEQRIMAEPEDNTPEVITNELKTECIFSVQATSNKEHQQWTLKPTAPFTFRR